MPESFIAGTTVKFSATYGDFPANQSWTTVLYVVGPSAFNVAGTPSGVSFDFVLSAAASAAAPPGNYSWEVRATKSGEVYVADSGVVEITINLATATTNLTWAAEMLPKIEDAIDKIVTGAVASYQIGNRSFVYADLAELRSLKASCEAKLRSERNPGSFLEDVNVTFANPDQ